MNNKAKTIFIVLDGLGDEEIPELDNKTPLQAAHTPNLDKWAKKGRLGLLFPAFKGNFPTSEEGHFSLFGYDPVKYGISRGIITASGVGLKIEEGDIALRGNFATIDNGKIINRRAGRIKRPGPLVKAIDGLEIDGVRFSVKSAKEHRLGIVMKGEGLNYNISNSDPHYGEGSGLEGVKPLDKSKSTIFTAKVLNKFFEKTHQILKEHSLNEKRKFPANYILTRGASGVVDLPSFEEKYGMRAACIGGKVFYKQIGKMIGMDVLRVKGADGTVRTNLEGKFKKAREAILSDYDFVFVHVKAIDTLGEDGDFWGKKDFIEEIDKNLSVLEEFMGVLVITSDHSTCSIQASHCAKEIPLLIKGKGKDNTSYFSEKECARGALGKIDQRNFLKKIVFGN